MPSDETYKRILLIENVLTEYAKISDKLDKETKEHFMGFVASQVKFSCHLWNKGDTCWVWEDLAKKTKAVHVVVLDDRRFEFNNRPYYKVLFEDKVGFFPSAGMFSTYEQIQEFGSYGKFVDLETGTKLVEEEDRIKKFEEEIEKICT